MPYFKKWSKNRTLKGLSFLLLTAIATTYSFSEIAAADQKFEQEFDRLLFKRDIEETKKLIQNGDVDLNRRFSHGDSWTPLTLTAKTRANSADNASDDDLLIELVNIFVDHGADVNLVVNGSSPFELAIEYQNYRIASRLIDLGSDVNALNEYSGLSAIHKACRATEDSSVELITKILERGGNPNSKSGKQGTPPLFICAGSDNIKGMKTLLSLGADKSQISNLGYDVLLYSALYSESPSTLQFAKTLTLNRSVNDNEGNNAMHLLIANQAGAELLAENCDLLDLMELPNRNGITPFTELFSSSSWRVTMAVRESCDYDIRNKKFANGRNAFHEFFSDPSTTEIKFSPGSGLVIGIDIDQQDKDGNTPLLLALLNKRSSKHIERLLELGADISITNNLGQDFDSLIHEYGYEEILKLSSKIRSIEKSIRSAESLDEVFLIMENEPPYYKRMMQISEQATLLSRLLTRLERGEPSRFQVLKTGFTKFLERNGLKRTEISHADIQTEDAEYMVKLVFSHASINQDYQGVLKLLNHLAIAEGGSLGNLMDCSVARRELQRVFDAVSLDETRQKLRDIIDPRGDDWCGLNQTQ